MLSAKAALALELRAAGPGIEGNDDVLRAVLAGCGDCIKILDLDGRLQFMSEGGKRVMEVDDFTPLKGCPWPSFWAGAGNADAINAVELARQGKTARFQGAANTAKGTPRYWDVQVAPIFGEDGQPAYLLSLSRDITEEWRATNELREAAERQKLLTEELSHRIKNSLAMVSAIAEQTIRGDDVSVARAAFTSRLVAFAHAHDALTQTSWISAPMRDVVDGALMPHRSDPSRVRVSGPEIMLPPKPALALSLAIHELSTNATKYGALSNETGYIDIVWSVEPAETLVFNWSETGGPPVSEARGRQGFGSRLIKGVLANDFNGEVTIDYRPAGVVCEMRSPLGHLAAQPTGN